MEIEIEVYKGQTIFYDVEYDKFICEITVEDKFKSTKRMSLKDIRKEIDSFLKINLEFKPFKVMNKAGWDEIKSYNITGIRTDGKFLFEKSDHYTSQETAAKLKEGYAQYDPQIEKEAEEAIAIYDKARKAYDKKKKELQSRMKELDLSRYEDFGKQK